MITRNDVYSYIEERVNLPSRKVYCASRLEPVPDEFPACYITEINRMQDRNAIDMQFSDEQRVLTYEVHVYSNLLNGALSEANAIMEDAESAFKSIYFIETYRGQVNNLDPTILHLAARFTRTVGGADTID